MAFLTDFRENPSTLSTDGDVVAAEDIALLGENTHTTSAGGRLRGALDSRLTAGDQSLHTGGGTPGLWGLRSWKESHKATVGADSIAFVCFCSYFPDFSSMITFRRLRLCSNSANRTKPTSQQTIRVETCRSDPEEHQLNFCSRMFTPAVPRVCVCVQSG